MFAQRSCGRKRKFGLPKGVRGNILSFFNVQWKWLLQKTFSSTLWPWIYFTNRPDAAASLVPPAPNPARPRG